MHDMTLEMTLDMVAKEKDISRDVLVQAIESAIQTAANKVFGAARDFEATYNPESGQVDLHQYMTVVEDVDDPDTEISIDRARAIDEQAADGDELGIQIFYILNSPDDKKKAAQQDKDYGDVLGVSQARQAFGRIAAQTAKQVIIQRVR